MSRIRKPRGEVAINRLTMTKEAWAAYMRAWRVKNKHRTPKKRRDDLDRGKPPASLCKQDPNAYHRQYRRWVRAGRLDTKRTFKHYGKENY